MSIARSALIGGPAKVSFNGGVYFSREDIDLAVEVSTSDQSASMHGEATDEVVTDVIAKIPMQLWGAWENLPLILPTSYTQPVIGSRIMTDADVPLVIASSAPSLAAGDVFTVRAAGITKLPDLYLGVDKPLFGPMEFTGVIGTGLDMETATSLYTISSAAYSDATFAKTNFKQQLYNAAWNGVTGFTAFQAQDGWTITHELKLEPVKIQTRTVDYKIIGYRCMAKCKPIGPTSTQLQTQLGVQGTANPLGHLLSANSADLVITGQNGVVVTIKNAALKGGKYVFGNKALRYGEFGWVSTVGFTAGVAQARATFA